MNKVPHPIFAKRIQQVMNENGWNKAELSKKVMLSHTSVQKWAKGLSVASGERLKRLAAVTGRPEHWFFMDQESDGSEQESSPRYRILDEKEETLLTLFNQLPEAEKLRLIIHTKGVIADMESLKSDVFDIINNSKK